MLNSVSGNHVNDQVQTGGEAFDYGPPNSLMHRVLTKRHYHLKQFNTHPDDKEFILVSDSGEGAQYYVGAIGNIYIALNNIGWLDDDGNIVP